MKYYFFVFALLIVSVSSFSQKCLTDYKYEQYKKQHPELQAEFDKMTHIQDYAPQQKTNAAVRIIPLVFHVIHEYGAENISKAQIEDAVRILNEDYRKLNPDTSDTRAIFKPYAIDCNIEFRLAKIDPNGNCTEGIERIYSPLTNDAGDNVKALSDWPNTKYLNIWVVKTIAAQGTGGGTILGYSQFPGGGAASTDGVIVRNDCIGRIGTEPNNGFGEYGRTLTHEIGHSLGLFHTFQGGCTGGGGDQVNDTPPASTANYGCVLTTNSCTNFTSPYTTDPPDMLENYMDYTNGTCQSLFTTGQKTRMDAAITQYRSNLVSAANAAATGVDGNGPTDCAPIADFIVLKTLGCTGASFSFVDYSYNGTITNWNWTFTGATTSISTFQNPTNITWSTPGTYAVTLVVSNTKGSNSKTRTAYVTVLPLQAPDLPPIFQGFEGTSITTDGWTIENGGNSTTWTRTTAAKKAGTASFVINHFSGTAYDDVDAFYSKGYNFTNMKQPYLTFYSAYAQKAVGVNDVLKMYISEDCGQSWQAKISKSGSSLAGGVAINANNYVPLDADWLLQQYDLNQYIGSPNVRFRFETRSRQGNNIYIDNINIFDKATGISLAGNSAIIDLQIAPNPFSDATSIAFVLSKPSTVSMKVVDMLGHEIVFFADKKMDGGEVNTAIAASQLQNLAGSIYFVNVTIDGTSYVRKFVKL